MGQFGEEKCIKVHGRRKVVAMLVKESDEIWRDGGEDGEKGW